MYRLSSIAVPSRQTSIQAPRTAPAAAALSASDASSNVPYTPLAVQALHDTRSGRDGGILLDAINDHLKMILGLAHDAERICPPLRITMQMESEASAVADVDLRPFLRLPMLVGLYLTVRQRLAFNDNGTFDIEGLITFVANGLGSTLEIAREHVLGTAEAERAYLGLRMTQDSRGIGAVAQGVFPSSTEPSSPLSANVDLIVLSSRLSTTGMARDALRGLNLQGVVVEKETLTHLDLTDTNLSDARFYHCRWDNVRVERAQLQRLVFFGGELYRCQFVDTNLAFAEFLGITFPPRTSTDGSLDPTPSGNLVGPRLSHSQVDAWSEVSSVDSHRLPIRRTRFIRCDFAHARFAGARLLRCRVENGELPAVTIENAAFSESILMGLVAPGMHWNDVTLTKTILQRISCPDSHFEHVRSLTGSSLTEVYFARCRVHALKLQTGTTMTDLDFTDARLSMVSFEGRLRADADSLIVAASPHMPCLNSIIFERTVCHEVQFLRCRFHRTSFSAVSMQTVMIRACDLGNTRFHQCMGLDLLGSPMGNMLDRTLFTQTSAVIPTSCLGELSDPSQARRQLDYIGNPLGLFGRILRIPDLDIRVQLIVRMLEHVSHIANRSLIDTPLLTALMRDEYAVDPDISAYVHDCLRRRLTEFNQVGLPIPVLSPASAWITRCPGRLCRMIEALADPRQYRCYSPLISFLLIGAKHHMLELSAEDTVCAKRIQAASLPRNFPIFSLPSRDGDASGRPLGLFLTIDGNCAVVLHPDAERMLFDPVNASWPMHPFIAIVKAGRSAGRSAGRNAEISGGRSVGRNVGPSGGGGGGGGSGMRGDGGSGGWRIDASNPPREVLALFPMLEQISHLRFA